MGTMKEQNKEMSSLDLLKQEIGEIYIELGLEPPEDVTGKGANYTVRFKKPSEEPSREEMLESMKRAAMALGKTEEEAEAMVANPW